MTVRLFLILVASASLTAGCQPPQEPVGPSSNGVPPLATEALPLTACAAGEGMVVPGWSVDNGHGAVSALAVSSSGTAALAGADGTIKLWHIESEELDWTSLASPEVAYGSEFDQAGTAASLSFDATGELITAGDEDGLVHLFSAADGMNIGSWSIGDAPVASSAFAYEGQLAVAATTEYGGGLHVWSTSGAPEEPLETGLWFIYDIAVDDTREEILIAGDFYGIPSIEVRSAAFPGAVLRGTRVNELSGGFVSAVPVGQGRVLAVGGGGMALLQPEADSEEGILAVREMPDVTFVSVLALDEEHFAAATEQGDILLGTIDDLTVRASMESSSISSLALVPGGWQLASSGEDGALRLHGCEG